MTSLRDWKKNKMPTYPDYVYQTLARAREDGQWHAAQSDAAALCFDVLAFFPDCKDASDLVFELFCDEWTIYDNRVALQQNIDEWDTVRGSSAAGWRFPTVL